MAFDARVQFSQGGIVNDAHDGLFANGEAERDAKGGIGMDKVGRSVNWVADERGGVGKFLSWEIRLFPDEGVARIRRLEACRDEGFDCAVRFGDEVCGCGECQRMYVYCENVEGYMISWCPRQLLTVVPLVACDLPRGQSRRGGREPLEGLVLPCCELWL